VLSDNGGRLTERVVVVRCLRDPESIFCHDVLVWMRQILRLFRQLRQFKLTLPTNWTWFLKDKCDTLLDSSDCFQSTGGPVSTAAATACVVPRSSRRGGAYTQDTSSYLPRKFTRSTKQVTATMELYVYNSSPWLSKSMSIDRDHSVIAFTNAFLALSAIFCSVLVTFGQKMTRTKPSLNFQVNSGGNDSHLFQHILEQIFISLCTRVVERSSLHNRELMVHSPGERE
jgi:hypothetical protein